MTEKAFQNVKIENTSVLILEDNPGDYILLERMLIEIGFQQEALKWAKTLDEFEYAGEDFILCDLNLPDSEGINTLSKVIKVINGDGASIIVLTGHDDEVTAQAAIQLGAQDYLVKGSFSKTFLRKTFTFAFERSKLMKQLQTEKKKTAQIEQYLTAVLSTVPGVIMRFNEEMVVEYVNRSFDPNITTTQIIGSSALDFLRPQDRPYILKEFDQLKRNFGMISIHTLNVDVAGQERSALVRVSAVDSQSFVLIATDVSELVEAQQTLQEESMRVKSYQMQLLSSQLNPHFVFNAMSSIQHSILHNDVEVSLSFISSFSSLMRKVLENSRKELLTWDEELSFLKNYLDIEKFRFENKFEYEFEVDPQVDEESVYIPPMLIQPYLENTVVHGIGNLKLRNGKIKLKLAKTAETMVFSIEDNGVGRGKAMELKSLRVGADHVSRAMTINKQRLQLLNDLYLSGDFKVKIDDLTDSLGNPSGTRIQIFFPAGIQH